MIRFYDNHNHSQFSFDGHRTTVEKTALRALDEGLGGICFTDHCDLFVPPMKAEHEKLVPEQFDIDAQQAEIEKCDKVIVGDGTADKGFRIFKGIEIGLQKKMRKEIRETLNAHKFDEVIASLHYLDDTDPFWGGYYEGKDWKEAYGHYLETLYEEMCWLGKDFDIMGHFDYVARYAPYPKASILYNDFPDILDAILKFLAEEGKALEINTKTYQDYNGRTPVLDPDILIRYRESGGEIISFGSDSHDSDRVGHEFSHYADFIKSLGFKYLAHFDNRRLVQTRL